MIHLISPGDGVACSWDGPEIRSLPKLPHWCSGGIENADSISLRDYYIGIIKVCEYIKNADKLIASGDLADARGSLYEARDALKAAFLYNNEPGVIIALAGKMNDAFYSILAKAIANEAKLEKRSLEFHDFREIALSLGDERTDHGKAMKEFSRIDIYPK
jgi:hypothetical protein